MAPKATTLGGFIEDLMKKQQHSNRSLAAAANISEGAVRNILKHGREPNAKDPDARTLQQLANALGVNPLRLYRLAGYLPPAPDVHSVRAEFVADAFDRLPYEKQEAVLSVLDAMSDSARVSEVVQSIRSDPQNKLAGFDLVDPNITRLIANELIAQYDMTEIVDLNRIEPDVQIFHYKWNTLPQSTQERIKALIRYKLSLEYDPTMVDPKWRE